MYLGGLEPNTGDKAFLNTATIAESLSKKQNKYGNIREKIPDKQNRDCWQLLKCRGSRSRR